MHLSTSLPFPSILHFYALGPPSGCPFWGGSAAHAHTPVLLTSLLGLPAAYGKVFLVRKAGGHDAGKLYAMKVLRKAALVQRAKTQEHTRTERSVLELVRQAPFLVTLHYAFQTDAKLHLILGRGTGQSRAAGGVRDHTSGGTP